MDIGIRVKIKKEFSVIRETLERIGIKNKKKKCFYPSCYCIETTTPEVYKIVHFKELFKLSNRESTFDDMDKVRRNTAIMLMEGWGILEVVDKNDIDEVLVEKIVVLKHSEKSQYKLIHKYKFNSHIVVD